MKDRVAQMQARITIGRLATGLLLFFSGCSANTPPAKTETPGAFEAGCGQFFASVGQRFKNRLKPRGR